VRILATLLRPDRGRARVAGFDVTRQPQAVRRLIGLSGQYAAVDPFLTGAENLVMIGRLYGLTGRGARRRAAELTEQLDLASAAGRLVRTYSGGMRRRLDIAASLMAAPPVLFLDEPTTGLDPAGRARAVAGPRAADGRGREPAADDPVHRGSRTARRDHRHHRPRTGDRPRHAR
jgi:ABC-2 type transport system ATP-binding protein